VAAGLQVPVTSPKVPVRRPCPCGRARWEPGVAASGAPGAPAVRISAADAEPSKDVTPVSEPANETFPPDETLTHERARELGHELGLRGDEYDRVEQTLGRIPTVSELGMYSVMWSEHCSYKS
jgi:hypothetical protein